MRRIINSTAITGDVAGEIARRKAQDGGDIVQYGFGPVPDVLLASGNVVLTYRVA
jgi:hypothetical protein